MPRNAGRSDLTRPLDAVAKARGATHCIDASKTAGVDGEIRKVVGPKGADKVLETTGVKAVIELAYELTPEATCVLVGVPSEKVTIYTLPIHFNKVLTAPATPGGCWRM